MVAISRYARRAMVYVAVLGTALLVTVVGVSALLAARLGLEGSNRAERAARADFAAQSATDLGLRAIAANKLWRTTYQNGVWNSLATDDGVTFEMKLVDELDGNLADDANEPVRLFGRATLAEVTRSFSVRLAPLPPDPSWVTNGGFESGTTGWAASICLAALSTASPHGGTSALRVYSRAAWSAGPYQMLASGITNGQTYDLRAWARTSSGTTTVRGGLYVRYGTASSAWFPGVGTLTAAQSAVWTEIPVTVTPTWTEPLIDIAVYFVTDTGTAPFYLDDVTLSVHHAQLQPAAIPIAGTWQREVEP